MQSIRDSNLAAYVNHKTYFGAVALRPAPEVMTAPHILAADDLLVMTRAENILSAVYFFSCRLYDHIKSSLVSRHIA